MARLNLTLPNALVDRIDARVEHLNSDGRCVSRAAYIRNALADHLSQPGTLTTPANDVAVRQRTRPGA